MASSQKAYGVRLARQMNANSEGMCAEESLDFAQSLNTALCFLCWINADASVVQEFLTCWPESLLLEGTSQDSASSILMQRMRRCKCDDERCNQNRQELLELIERGFQYYQGRHMDRLMCRDGERLEDPRMAAWKSTSIFPQLMSTGRYLRNLSVEESAVYGDILEAHVAKEVAERHLREARTVSTKKGSRVRSLLACGSKRANEQAFLVATLEQNLQMAAFKLASVEQEHRLLVNAIDQGHRNQYALLRRAFEGCARHECIPIYRQAGEVGD
jgi:hypothetical protein